MFPLLVVSFILVLGAVLEGVPKSGIPDASIPPDLTATPTMTGNDLRFTETGLPLRGRPRFSKDTSPSQESSINKCRKVGAKIKEKTGGVFSFFCRHGFCYGCVQSRWPMPNLIPLARFHVMHSSEGRNDPFSVLKTYLRDPPKLIVYDFACSLEEYCLNRDPWWFRDTMFAIDRFHWKNHRSYAYIVAGFCSPGLAGAQRAST